MADITMCNDQQCPKKDTCYRFIAPACPYMQSYYSVSPRKEASEECDDYWEVRDKSTKRRLDIQTSDDL